MNKAVFNEASVLFAEQCGQVCRHMSGRFAETVMAGLPHVAWQI
jgi:hypothetical protein